MNKTSLISFISAVAMMYSCTSTDSQNNTSQSSEQNPATESSATKPEPAAESMVQPQGEVSNPATTAQVPAPASPANALFHYICPNRCAGGGSEGQGKCPVCKTDLIHNDAFHQAQQQQPQLNVQPQNNQIQLNTANQMQQQQPPAPESPQNAKGVWHYTCPKGCAGGGGQAIACANCGTQMEHNQKYHE
ncbi:MAG: hypothetical protein JNL47_01165 [Bacteroidia bacterium]|nr:hypothetical protein [Bacteroidia bacterium]